MEDELIHTLSAGYALHSLSPEAEREFEAHLAGCARCREELAAFSAVAAGLAYGVPPEQPPAALRARILETARAERRNVLPLRPRWAYPAVATAAVASVAAVALGIWAASLHSQLGSSLHALPLQGAAGSVVVARHGEATLVVAGLPRVPAGKTYEVWVLKGHTATSAGLFAASSASLHLTRSVPRGAKVAVTLERAGGVEQPTSTPLVTSTSA